MIGDDEAEGTRLPYDDATLAHFAKVVAWMRKHGVRRLDGDEIELEPAISSEARRVRRVVPG